MSTVAFEELGEDAVVDLLDRGLDDVELALVDDSELELLTLIEGTQLPSHPAKRTRLFGVQVDALTMAESVDRATELVERAGPAVHHVCINAAKVVRMQDDAELRRIIESSEMVHVDGTSVCWAAGLLGAGIPERVAGIDFMDALLARAAERGWRVFFLGATDEVVERTVAVELERHPGLQVAGWRNGFWTEDEEDAVVAAVAATAPDLLLLALPTPKKELFASRRLEALNARFVMGVGGSFDVAAGITKRAPLWMQRAGLEWFFRLVQEPRRMWKRYLVGNSRFIALVARELVTRPRAARAAVVPT
jgi:N-acetylglucosaminyldiphosphoundecaprenol N-acetyl-beta-D-mannosaminyltransferase